MKLMTLLAVMAMANAAPIKGDQYDCFAKKKKGSGDQAGRISSANSESDAVSQYKERWPGYETYYCVKVKK